MFCLCEGGNYARVIVSVKLNGINSNYKLKFEIQKCGQILCAHKPQIFVCAQRLRILHMRKCSWYFMDFVVTSNTAKIQSTKICMFATFGVFLTCTHVRMMMTLHIASNTYLYK